MRIPLAVFIVLAGLNGQALAQTYVVEFDGMVFDRELTEFERKRVRTLAMQAGPKDYRVALEEQRLAYLRENARELFRTKCTLVAGTSEIASQYLRDEDMKFEVHVRVMEADKEKCKLDLHVGVAYAINERLVATSMVTNPVTVRFGRPWTIAQSSGQALNAARQVTASYSQELTVRVREATEDDLALKTIQQNFGADLLKKPIAPAQGGMLMAR